MANLTGIVDRLLSVIRAKRTGFIGFSGRVRRLEQLMTGVVSYGLNWARTKSSGISFSGSVIGDLGQGFNKAYSSVLSLTKALSYTHLIEIAKSSAISFSGIVSSIYNYSRTKTANLITSGAVTRTNAILTKSYSGSVGFVGTLVRGIFKTYSGAVTFVGDVSRSAISSIYTASGALSSAGSAARTSFVARSKAGALSFSNTLTGVKDALVDFYWQGATGALNFSSTLSELQGRAADTLTGSMKVYGRITIIDAVVKRLTDASTTPAGAISRYLITTRSERQGVLSFTALLSRLYSITRTFQDSALTFAGAAVASISSLRFYTASGIILFAGSLSSIYQILRFYAGSVSLNGTITNAYELFRTHAGGVSFSGAVESLFIERDWRQGYLTFAGAVSRALVSEPVFKESELAFAGVVTRQINNLNLTVSGELNSSGRVIEKIRETLWLGPPNP